MGLKDILKKKSAEYLEKEREAHELVEKTAGEANEQAELDIVPVPPHPLRKLGDDVLGDYMLGQLILRGEMPPTDADGGSRLVLLARSLGLDRGRLDEISDVAALYDDQAKAEHLEKLGGILHNGDEIDCFLCDVAFLYGNFDGGMPYFWRTMCFGGIFKLDERRTASLENLCKAMSEGRLSADREAFGDVSGEVIDYCLEWNHSALAMGTYLVIDFSRGLAGDYPVRPTFSGPDLNGDACRTTELWLRRIPAGTFMMGSPLSELGRFDNEQQHSVTLTRDFYIGVFPVTQRQWELVMGDNPSDFKAAGPTAPVESVSYDAICGISRKWPANPNVASGSFLGRLRSRTSQESFDLPTDAQWEYACRAGTATALNSRLDLTSLEESCCNLDAVGWYDMNSGGMTHPVGQKQPNAWRLYDMHGNVWEWCRDWYGGYPSNNVTDPPGGSSGTTRV
ncbi:MAG: formylglycine-generating enzyme family protein, partial [Lentisphaeria bacterium]|nr:formylglycine-generating enzyme family protein [Lentisphaeria bacterium]